MITAINNANAHGGDSITLFHNGTYSFSTANNFWYGPDALPAISSTITINGDGATLTYSGATPSRLVFVSGGLTNPSSILPAGSLTMNALTIEGFKAQGGSGGSGFAGGGGGAGLGGAIFNQGVLILDSVLFTDNMAVGGTGGVGLGGANGPWRRRSRCGG